MIELVEVLKDKLHIYYFDYAPSLVSDKYIVSLAIDKDGKYFVFAEDAGNLIGSGLLYCGVG